ncbi:hypothetical protein PMAYCL1PPCAC_04602, partial [Pristionchus mayeri]
YAAHALHLLVAYGSIVVLISIARLLTPHTALEDIRMPSLEQEQFLNSSRLKHQQLQEKFSYRSMSSNLAITIVTANRAHPYVHAVLGSLVDAYGGDLPQVTLCSVEPKSNEVTEQLRREKWTVVDVNKDKQFNKTVLSQRIAKETADYWKCLNLTRNSGYRYTLLLEDDISVHGRFRSMIDSLIYQV